MFPEAEVPQPTKRSNGRTTNSFRKEVNSGWRVRRRASRQYAVAHCPRKIASGRVAVGVYHAAAESFKPVKRD